jgi:hypothetical protein
MKSQIGSVIIMFAGSVFLFLTLPDILLSVSMRKNGIIAESIVLSSERTGRKAELDKVTVSFTTAEGNKINATGLRREYVNPGDKVKIFYDRENPQIIDFGDTIGYNLRGALTGGFLFLTGLFLFIRYYIKGNTQKKLIRSGRKIAGEFISIDRNERYRMGDKNPWVIKCRWIDESNIEYYFTSKDYLIDPAPYLSGRSCIDVFIDPDDPDRYFMDTSFMPKGNNTIG